MYCSLVKEVGQSGNKNLEDNVHFSNLAGGPSPILGSFLVLLLEWSLFTNGTVETIDFAVLKRVFEGGTDNGVLDKLILFLNLLKATDSGSAVLS